MTIKITIIEGDFSDLLPLLITLLPQQRDESGRRPAPPFSSPFPRGFRVSSPFNLEDLFETMGRETDGKGEEPENAFEDLEKVFKGLYDRATEEHARATGDDTPPEREPEGSEQQG
jgi:hypothetical protein